MFTIAPFAPVVNSALPIIAPAVEVADDYRPTTGPDFTPTPEELAEAAELLNDEGEPDWDALADDAHALAVVSTGYAWL
jgi:hypothetical protein